MSYLRLQELSLALEKALHRKIPDDFIGSYRDFVKWREYLPHMQYNPRVMHAMAIVATDVWDSTARINRFELLRCMVRYRKRTRAVGYYSGLEPLQHDLLPETETLLFDFCLRILGSRHLPVSEIQQEAIKKYANVLLMRVQLDKDRVGELIDNLYDTPQLVNRLLRYPKVNLHISRWAMREMENPEWAYRRGEMAGMVLDLDPDFVVSTAILKADFDEMNRRDSEKTALLLRQQQDYQRNHQDFPELFDNPRLPALEHDWDEPEPTVEEEWKPRLNLDLFPNRPCMRMPITFSGTLNMHVPDIASGKAMFAESLPRIQSCTMLRAVQYSHLSKSKKLTLFKRHYHPDNSLMAFGIAKKLNHAGMLRWLLEKAGK